MPAPAGAQLARTRHNPEKPQKSFRLQRENGVGRRLIYAAMAD
jgi:hypothetical protein